MGTLGKRGIPVVSAIILLCGASTPVSSQSEHRNLAASATPTSTAFKGFVQNIEKLSGDNNNFRRVLYTAKHMQLVVMALKPGEDIGEETHADVDQFFRVEQGSGESVLNGNKTPIKAGFAVLIPAGTKHNIVNTGSTPMKLYTLYSPPNHRDGVVHQTKAQAESDKEHFDGRTTQ